MTSPNPLPSGRVEIGPDGLLSRCPECAGQELRFVSDGELANFLCLTCGCCWHLELGWIHRVDPGTCLGCESRPICSASRVPHHARPELSDSRARPG